MNQTSRGNNYKDCYASILIANDSIIEVTRISIALADGIFSNIFLWELEFSVFYNCAF